MFFLLQPFCCDPALNILHHGCWRQNCPNHPGLCSLPIPDLGSLGRGSGERRGGGHTLEFFFAVTPLKAVTSSIKLAARKLGLSLSATIPSSAKKFPNMGRQVILWSFPISRSSSWPHLSMCPQSWLLGKSELRMGSTVLFAMSLKLVWWAPSKTQRIGLWK